MVLNSFVPVAEDSPFSIENLPYGIFSTRADPVPRPGVAIGDHILDLKCLADVNIFGTSCNCQFDLQTLTKTTLNDFAALGRELTGAVRLAVKYLLVDTTPVLRDDLELRSRCIVLHSDAEMHLPFAIGDFTDFLNSRTHAKNTHVSHEGSVNMFNPPRAFSGRASSIVPSGTGVVRPLGHLFDKNGIPYVGPSNELDVELELAFFIGTPNEQFMRIPIEEAEEHIFGVVMLNDWSTRDIQKGEDFPFAAFNAKNFASTISPWVVTMDALQPFKIPAQPRDALDMLPYLTDTDDSTYDINISMDWTLGKERETFKTSTSNLRNAYWSFKQMLTHNAFAGCPMRTGDLVGTGTITGEDPSSICSLVEMTKNGTEKVATPGGHIRTYVEDHDEVTFTAWCGEGLSGKAGVGFGECKGVILPAML